MTDAQTTIQTLSGRSVIKGETSLLSSFSGIKYVPPQIRLAHRANNAPDITTFLSSFSSLDLITVDTPITIITIAIIA